MDLQSILKMLQESNQKGYDQLKDVTAQTVDRIRMSDPSIQGPHLANTTPEEKDYYDNLTAAVSGSISPVIPKIKVPSLSGIISKETPNLLKGGVADAKKITEFSPNKILQGTKVELEHTSNPNVAKEIAMDHLSEDSQYYNKLDKMENPRSSSIKQRADTVASDAMDSKLISKPNVDDVKRSQQALSRKIDFEQRDKLAKLRKFK
jgi:hypothetical protein